MISNASFKRKLNRINDLFNNTNTFYIIVQRFIYRMRFCNCCKIIVQTKGGFTIEEEKTIEYNVEDNSFDTKEFKESCISSANRCNKYITIFKILESLCKLSNISCVTFIPLYINFIKINNNLIFILVSFFFIITFLDILCEWGKLCEKYATLKRNFLKLSIKIPTIDITCFNEILDEYESLVILFKNYELFSDK